MNPFLVSTTHGRTVRRGTLARILLLPPLLCQCHGYQAHEAAVATIAAENPTSSLSVAAPEAKLPPSTTNIFTSPRRRKTKSKSKHSYSRDETPSPIQQKETPSPQSRLETLTSTPTPTPKPTQAPFGSSYEPKLKEPLVLKATGNTMTLGGVEPLDKNSWLAWGKVTGNFIRSDMKNSSKEVDGLEVSILFVSQNPPLDEVSGRALMKLEERSIQVKEQELTFDVDILIQSDLEVQDAQSYVASAFNSDAKQTSYLQKLRATGNSSFADVETISVSVRPSSSKPSKEETVAIGIMVASMFVAVIFLCIAVFLLRGNRANATEHVVKTEDSTGDIQVKTYTESFSSVNDRSNDHTDEDQSHASVYWQGAIEVSLSADTDLENTPHVSHPRLLITKSESSIDDNSLFTEDGFERYMYSTGKKSKLEKRFEM